MRFTESRNRGWSKDVHRTRRYCGTRGQGVTLYIQCNDVCASTRCAETRLPSSSVHVALYRNRIFGVSARLGMRVFSSAERDVHVRLSCVLVRIRTATHRVGRGLVVQDHPATSVATAPERQARGVRYHGDGSDKKGAYDPLENVACREGLSNNRRFRPFAHVSRVLADPVDALSGVRARVPPTNKRVREATMENKRRPASRRPRDSSVARGIAAADWPTRVPPPSAEHCAQPRPRDQWDPWRRRHSPRSTRTLTRDRDDRRRRPGWEPGRGLSHIVDKERRV